MNGITELLKSLEDLSKAVSSKERKQNKELKVKQKTILEQIKKIKRIKRSQVK